MREPECVFQLDSSGNIIKINNAGLRTLGAERLEDVAGVSILQRTYEGDRQALLEKLELAVAGETSEIVVRFQNWLAETVWLHLKLAAAFLAEGQDIVVISLFKDISQQQLLRIESEAARKALEESESRFEVAFHSSPVALVMATFDRRYVEANEAFCKLVGYSREEVIGRNVADLQLVTPDEREELARNLIAAGGKMRNIEFRLTIKDGSVRNVLYSVETVSLHGIPHHLATFIDITERKLLEAQFLRAQRMESIGTLASGIAHDLNNLLSPIVMGVDLIRQIEASPKLSPILKTIEDSGKRGTHLVQQVLSFARGVEGARIPVQIDAVVREVESIIAKTFPKNISFEYSGCKRLPAVVGDPTQLHQVLLNLCVNARDAMEHGGLLKISTQNIEVDQAFCYKHGGQECGPHVALSVTDEGTGMDTKTLERAFEPFFTTKERGKGTGLGLSSVVGIVRSHGGFITASSSPEAGSCFTVFLPVGKTPDPDASPRSGVVELPRGAGEWILLVDDEGSILRITQQMLESYGYRVITAEEGTAALRAFDQHPDSIDLIITDLMMPGMDGYALIRALRGRGHNLPIIAASGLTDKDSPSRSIAAGANQFMAKPYAIDRILAVLKKLLSWETRE